MLAFSAENIGQKELFSLMSYGLLIEFVHCLFKDLVKGRQFQVLKTDFMKELTELAFKKRLTKVTNFKTIVLPNFRSLVKVSKRLEIIKE